MNTIYRYVFDKNTTGGIKVVPVTDVQTSNDDLSVESEEIIEQTPTEQEQTTETTVDSDYQQKMLDIQTQQTYLLLFIAFGVMLLNGFILARIVWRKL